MSNKGNQHQYVDWAVFAEKLNEKGQGRAPLVQKSRFESGGTVIGFLLEMRPYEEIDMSWGLFSDADNQGDQGVDAFLRFQPLDRIPEHVGVRLYRLLFSFDEAKTWQTFEEVMA